MQSDLEASRRMHKNLTETIKRNFNQEGKSIKVGRAAGGAGEQLERCNASSNTYVGWRCDLLPSLHAPLCPAAGVGGNSDEEGGAAEGAGGQGSGAGAGPGGGLQSVGGLCRNGAGNCWSAKLLCGKAS